VADPDGRISFTPTEEGNIALQKRVRGSVAVSRFGENFHQMRQLMDWMMEERGADLPLRENRTPEASLGGVRTQTGGEGASKWLPWVKKGRDVLGRKDIHILIGDEKYQQKGTDRDPRGGEGFNTQGKKKLVGATPLLTHQVKGTLGTTRPKKSSTYRHAAFGAGPPGISRGGRATNANGQADGVKGEGKLWSFLLKCREKSNSFC